MTTKVKEANKIRRRLLNYALRNGYVLNPGRSMEHYVEIILKFDRCPCDPNRKRCPCPQAAKEVEVEGHCRCSLYWKSYRHYMKTLTGGQDERIHEERSAEVC